MVKMRTYKKEESFEILNKTTIKMKIKVKMKTKTKTRTESEMLILVHEFKAFKSTETNKT